MKTIEQNAVSGKPRAIETGYRGFRFRSRLEARWAVFFDRMGIEWLYEPEGYELPSGRYLPDFFLRDENVFAEIKPGPKPVILYPVKPPRGEQYLVERWPVQREQTLMRELADGLQRGGIVLYGEPIQVFNPSYVGTEAWVNELGHMLWAKLRRNPTLRDAALAARQARFEFGEQS